MCEDIREKAEHLLDAFYKGYNPYPEIELLDDQVLIRLIHPERMTASKLLWIPAIAKRQPYELYNGIVEAIGPGLRKEKDLLANEVAHPTPIYSEYVQPMDVKVGDKVTFYFLGGMTGKKWPDDDHLIIPESFIQLVWND